MTGHLIDAERAVVEDEILDWETCSDCGGECVIGHDCGEDTCCCLEPEDNVVCPTCDGRGGWEVRL